MILNFLFKPLLISCTVVLVLVACSHDSWIELGNEYAYITTNAHNHSIAKGRKIVVYTNVVEYQVQGNFIWGRREKSVQPDVSQDLLKQSEYGYFVVDMASEMIMTGLSKDEVDQYILNGDQMRANR